MAEKRIYVPGSSAKEIQFNNGGSVINLSFRADELIKFAEEHGNEDGWLNLSVSERQEVSEKGATHSIYLNTYRPKNRTDAQPEQEQRRSAPPQRQSPPRQEPQDRRSAGETGGF